MLDVAPTELLLVAAVALVVIGPKDLPKVMRTVGRWVGRARGVASHFRSGFDQMVREAELEEMEKRWAAENARIMREHPAPADGAASVPAPLDHDSAPQVTPGFRAPDPFDQAGPLDVEPPESPARDDTPPAQAGDPAVPQGAQPADEGRDASRLLP